VSVCQCGNAVFQNISLIIVRCQTYFVDIHSIQDVVLAAKHLEFGGRGACLYDCFTKEYGR